jgi:hypothetical protein
MSQVYVDPQQLRAFASKLKSFAEFVDGQANSITTDLGRLGETWRDQEYDDFIEYFNRAKQMLRKFTEETNRTVPLLERDADLAEEYLQLKSGI